MAGSSLLSACASVDLGPEATLKPSQSYAVAQTLEAPRADWPSDAWWRGYGDPQLTQLIDEALSNSPTMAAAEARVRRAEALRALANAAMMPKLGAQVMANAAAVDLGDLGGVGGDASSDVSTAGLALLRGSYDFDIWGRNKASLAAAAGEAEAARADAAQARLTLATAIAAAYGDLARESALADAAASAVEVRRKTAELMAERQANGLENRGSVSQTRAELAQSEAQRGAALEALALTKNRIAALLGAGPDRGLTIATPGAAAVKLFGLPAQLQADLVGRRPDIVAARLRAEAASRRVKVARTGFYPNLNLSAFAGSAVLDLLSPGAPILFAALGPALSLPIYNGGREEGEVRRAGAEYDLAVAEYNRTVTEAFQEVADVVASERALAQRLERTQAALVASEDAYRVAGDRYHAGLVSLIEVLRAEDAVIANRRALAEVQTRGFQLDIALVRALGGGYGA